MSLKRFMQIKDGFFIKGIDYSDEESGIFYRTMSPDMVSYKLARAIKYVMNSVYPGTSPAAMHSTRATLITLAYVGPEFLESELVGIGFLQWLGERSLNIPLANKLSFFEANNIIVLKQWRGRGIAKGITKRRLAAFPLMVSLAKSAYAAGKSLMRHFDNSRINDRVILEALKNPVLRTNITTPEWEPGFLKVVAEFGVPGYKIGANETLTLLQAIDKVDLQGVFGHFEEDSNVGASLSSTRFYWSDGCYRSEENEQIVLHTDLPGLEQQWREWSAVPMLQEYENVLRLYGGEMNKLVGPYMLVSDVIHDFSEMTMEDAEAAKQKVMRAYRRQKVKNVVSIKMPPVPTKYWTVGLSAA